MNLKTYMMLAGKADILLINALEVALKTDGLLHQFGASVMIRTGFAAQDTISALPADWNPSMTEPEVRQFLIEQGMDAVGLAEAGFDVASSELTAAMQVRADNAKVNSENLTVDLSGVGLDTKPAILGEGESLHDLVQDRGNAAQAFEGEGLGEDWKPVEPVEPDSIDGMQGHA